MFNFLPFSILLCIVFFLQNDLSIVQVGTGAAGAAGGAGGGAPPPPRPTESNYSNDTNWAKALNFQSFKEAAKNSNVFQIHTGQSFIKDFKVGRVNDLLAEFHMQYLYVMEKKIIPMRIPIENYNGGLFNANDMHHPFNQFKRWVVLPVLARHGGVFPAGTMVDGVNALQAAQNWISNVVYDN